MPENWGKHGGHPGTGLSVEQRAPGFNKGNPPPQAAGEGTQGLGGEGGGTAARFERETPDRWGCPRFHDWLPLSWLPAPSPRPTPLLPSRGGPVGTRGGGPSIAAMSPAHGGVVGTPSPVLEPQHPAVS